MHNKIYLRHTLCGDPKGRKDQALDKRGERVAKMFELQQTLKQEKRQLQICGGMTGTETIFPEIEELLKESTELQKALRWLIKGPYIRNNVKYRSVMDALYCSLEGTEARLACLRYYRGKGKQLRFLRHLMPSEEHRLRTVYKMLWSLKQAYEVQQEKYRETSSRLGGWTNI